MNNISELHKPVMLERCIELLGEELQSDKAVLIDGTLGLAGHSEAFLQRFPKLTLVGIDRDLNALKLAKERLANYSNRVHLVQGIYSDIPEILEDLGIKLVDAVLLDLGVSSMQLDKTERGFSYSQNAPLDMRMDNTAGITAAEVINQYSEKDLTRIFKTFGEERFAKPIAKKIVQLRDGEPFVSSKQLTEVIGKVVPFIPGKSSGHPAKRVFQALRIEVNNELGILAETLPAVISSLRVGGRVVVLSYHSLEDRIVKQALVSASTSSAPVDLPIELAEHAPTLRLLVRGAEMASDEEIQNNPRSASVRLRAAEKIRDAA
ncbi:MAG: 16S rRNA (cytosine(1402)-N(4))-methyltransferase RsmH [Actinobacteria bacterium]|nr:16S rRNA (cytosine(1402)-N(4))-methyltransferase RsmH [Actinomycetota bacterium]